MFFIQIFRGLPLSRKLLVIFVITCCSTFNACRKKTERYEGAYTGIERLVEIDSGVAGYALDTSYHQVFDLTYYKKHYIVLRQFNNPYGSEFAIHRDDIVDHEYIPFSE